VVLVIGDSISAGYGIQRELGWVELLADRLADHTDNFLVVNASVSGDTTGGGRGRLPLALDLHNPEVVIIELGANDALRGYPISEIRANLIFMAQAALAIGADVIIVGMQIPPNYGPRYTRAFRDVFAEVAHTTDTSLVPFLLDGIAFDGSMMQLDGLHPTAAAQTLLLGNIWPTLAPIIFGN
jgi:acyl-CoA thioesterase-1